MRLNCLVLLTGFFSIYYIREYDFILNQFRIVYIYIYLEEYEEIIESIVPTLSAIWQYAPQIYRIIFPIHFINSEIVYIKSEHMQFFIVCK